MSDPKPIPNVTDDQYDGRDFVGEDNVEGVEHYVGVDPIYQAYANEGERPYPFSQEEIDEAARRGGLDPDEDSDAGDEDEEVEGDKKSTVKKASASSAPKAPVPAPRPTSEK